jgi:xanthine dehydrogenase YagS FAD-binding subunit
VLIAYGAKIRLFGRGGARELPLEKFFIIPQNENQREHDLRPNEIVTDIIVPPASGVRAAHYEVRQKEAFDWPYVTASVLLKMSGDNVQSARIVMSHVAPIPWISNEASQAITGKAITDETADAAGAAAVANAKSLGHNKHKIKLARVAVKRALLKAAKGEA